MRTYNQLSYKELQKLMEYLNREKGFLFQSRPSYRGVAATATSVLLFNVTETNVRTAARLAGMTWKANPERKPKVRPPEPTSPILYNDLVKRIEFIEKELGIVNLCPKQ